ncbi:MAG: ABC transporter permease [Gemmatimonadaceae bacterium]
MTSIAKDARYAIRRLLSAPGFTVAAVLTLALGIGANSTIFSVVNAILLRPPAHVRAPERIVSLYTSDHSGPPYGTSSYPDYDVFREQTAVFEGVTLFMPRQVGIGDGIDVLRLQGELVAGNYFTVLGVPLQQGRAFTSEEAAPGAPAVVVISDGLWRTKFNADPRVIGAAVRINENPFTVVGVAPPRYSGAIRGLAIDVWVPIASARHLAVDESDITVRGNRSSFVIARLSTGTTIETAQSAMNVVAQRLLAAYPAEWRDVSGKGRRITLVSEKDSRIPPVVRGPVLGFFALLIGTVALVLLVCCANVAGLLLARATARTREIAIRLSLGATQRQLIRQLLVESVVLATVGAVVGLALAFAATQVIATAALPIPVRIALDVSLDTRVVLFTAIVALGAGVLFGLIPALRASRPGLVTALKTDAGSVAVGRQRLALQKLLVVSQVAMSLLLLVGASLFLRSLSYAARIDPGFRTDHLLVVSAEPRPGAREEANRAVLALDMQRRIAAIPGVNAVSWTSARPLGLGGSRRWTQIEGYQRRQGEDMEFHYAVVGPRFFETLEIAIARGRALNATDRAGAPGAIVVNESFAQRFWPNGDALGKRLTSGQEYAIVGIARDGKYLALGEPARPYLYFPALQTSGDVELVVRASTEPRALIDAVRREIINAAPSWQALNARTMDDQVAASLLPQRVAAAVLWLFGVVALLLAAVGLYGVIAYSVTTRTREIGVRIALGAQRSDVVRSVVKESLTLVALGALIGVPAAWAATRLISGFLLGVTSSDPFAYGAAIAVLAAVTLAASWLPARRASRVDPVVAFKT